MRLPFGILAAALLCGAALVSSADAGASREASFALKPLKYDPALAATKSYFILSTHSGDVIKDQIRVVNTGGKTGTAYLYAVDATTGQTSGAVYLSRQSPRRDVGAWITLSRSRVTLAPGKNAVVDFTIRVPRSAGPGDHLGGIVAENAQVQSSTDQGALQIKIRHLTITAVELQLPGRAVGRVVATGVKPGGEHGYQYVYLHLKSTGTVMVKPFLTLIVRSSAGKIVAGRTLQLDTFVPRTEIDYPALLPRQALKPGRYTADVRLRSSTDAVLGYRKTPVPPFEVSRTFPFTVTSGEQTKVFSGVAPVSRSEQTSKPAGSKSNDLMLGVVVVLGLLLVVVFGVLFTLLRRRRRGRPPASVAAQPPTSPATGPATAVGPPNGEEHGWLDLLAAYESQPRAAQTNGSSDNAGPDAPAQVAAAAPAPVAKTVPEPETAFELQPEPWFGPEPEIEYMPEPQPGFELEPEHGGADVVSSKEIEELIVRHDLAVARAPLPVVQPQPQAETDVQKLSSALVEASLLTLAALLALRLMKTAE